MAWEAGVLAGLAEAGVTLDADLVVGTSAGAMVAARLTTGWTTEQIHAALSAAAGRSGRAGPAAVARLAAAQVHPSRRHALVWLGRRAARTWSTEAERRWIEALAPDLSGCDWPTPLVVVATDANSGRPAYFSAAQPTDLAVAVAASCALPGVFPAVRVDGRLHFDGGLRSPLNLDLAAGAESVIAVAPLSASLRAHRRPRHQAAQLRREGVRTLLIEPSAAGRAAMGMDPLAPGRADRSFAAGVADAERLADQALATWTAT